MGVPIVFISRNRILGGRSAAFEAAYAQAVRLIDANKPQTALFAAYVNADRTEVSIVHVFPDPAAMGLHFEGSGERTRSVSDLIAQTRFEVYGQAPPAAVDQLKGEASAAGIGLDLLLHPIGGFLRGPA